MFFVFVFFSAEKSQIIYFVVMDKICFYNLGGYFLVHFTQWMVTIIIPFTRKLLFFFLPILLDSLNTPELCIRNTIFYGHIFCSHRAHSNVEFGPFTIVQALGIIIFDKIFVGIISNGQLVLEIDILLFLVGNPVIHQNSFCFMDLY